MLKIETDAPKCNVLRYGSNKNSNKDKSGIGLENMRERISAFNGNIRFSDENGFRIFISIPKEM